MAFTVTVSWTQAGAASRALYVTNQNIQSPENFFSALNDCIRGYAAIHFSQTDPQYEHNGYGQFSWMDGNQPRTADVGFAFNSANWQASIHVRMNMLSLN